MRNKCPYLSTGLECFAGSFGTVHCLTHEFHSKCGFKAAADKKGNPGISILDNHAGMLDNLIAINF
ncbi:MAG: hypothetical protein J4400_02180 [Candidatus Aenigmarchaeota archaeon]|nr:hypothetical protein [Candidatus Aenigmarchaeota archaeon]